MSQESVKVVFICMGNICRSPLAQGVFEHQVAQAGLGHLIGIDSAGTHAYHIGKQPDPRSQAVARRQGIDLSGQRARQFDAGDFETYDYVLAMDRDNLAILQRACPPAHQQKVQLFMDFAPRRVEDEVPDPYYGGPGGFEYVYELVAEAGEGLLKHIRQAHL